MLRQRVPTAIFLISIVAALVWLDATFSPDGAEGLFLLPLLLFVALGTAWDFTGLLIGSGRNVARKTVMVATAIVSLSAAVPMLWAFSIDGYPPNCPVGRLGWIVLAVVAGTSLVLLAEMARYGKGPSGAIERSSLGVLVVVYVGVPMALWVALRTMSADRWGLIAMAVAIAVTKASDTGAYFTGKAIGRNKLIPRLSPGKTREGAVGGIVASTLVAWVCLRFFMPDHPTSSASIAWLANPVVAAGVLGPTLAIAGMIGDLAESMVKRDCGAKDSGTLLPGMGGVWDVSDSLIAAAAPAFLAFASGIGHGSA